MNNRGYGLAILVFGLCLAACQNKEQEAQHHVEKGKALMEQGDIEQAVLELKSSQGSENRADTYYYMALLDEKNNKYRSMRENLNRSLELDANQPKVREKLGKVLLLFGDLDAVMAQADLLLATDPNNITALNLKASVLSRKGDKQQASQLIERVLAANPSDLDAMALKASLLFDEKKIDQTLDVLNSALKVDNKNIPTRLFKIRIYANQDRTGDVINEYKELVNLYPDMESLRVSLAAVYSMNGDLALAEEQLRKIVSNAPDKPGLKLVLLEFLNSKAKEKVPGELDTMMVSYKDSSPALMELAQWMLANGYADQGGKALQMVVDKEKDSKVALAARTVQGEVQLNKKDFPALEATLAKIFAEDPDYFDAILLKSRLMLANNQIDEAIDLLNKAIWSKSDSDNANLLLAEAYLAKKDYKQADRFFKAALEINPGNIDAFMPIYNNYLQANQLETARQYLNRALAAKPNQAVLMSKKAELDIVQGKWDDAQETVNSLTMLAKNKAVPSYLQANIDQGTGKYREAIAIYEKLLEEAPGHLNCMRNVVSSYEALKERDKALAYMEAHHKKNPDNLVVTGVLGDLYVYNKDYAKAAQLLAQQVQLTPGIPSLYIALANLQYSEMNNPAAAEATYQQGLKANPDDVQITMGLAVLAEQMHHTPQARQLYESILSKQEYLPALNNLAALLDNSDAPEDLNTALTLAEKLKDTNNPYFQDTYSWALIRKGQNPEGLKILEALILKEPKVPEFRYHLGIAHLNSGNTATAMNELKQAITLSDRAKKDFAGKEQAIAKLKQLQGKS
jgi:tetratricopeptide (TPR) repeat protein